LKKTSRDADMLRTLLQIKKEKGGGNAHIEDTQRLVTELRRLKSLDRIEFGDEKKK
jgi:hypothetical protein